VKFLKFSGWLAITGGRPLKKSEKSPNLKWIMGCNS
jgi:hypothetical protein